MNIIRYVTPTTPHDMTRRSAGTINFSQDMLEETVQQVHHIFYLSMGPSNTPAILQQTKSEQIIIMHEMANAVICPDTGKSFKHSERITLLRYKIR
jgi:hypothetical protein